MMTGEISMASAPRIAVVGSANTDLITYSDTFPQAGETLFGKRFDLGFGGKGCHPQILSGATVGAKKYSWWRPPSTAFARTATSSRRRCRDPELKL
jgi:hypothetical protein